MEVELSIGLKKFSTKKSNDLSYSKWSRQISLKIIFKISILSLEIVALKTIILYVGRLEEYKGIRVFLNAVFKLLKK